MARKRKPESIKETLELARDLITPLSRWVQGIEGETEDGIEVAGSDRDAVKWCALGALSKVDGKWERVAVARLEEACQELFNGGVVYVNDNLGHQEILKAFRYAIKSQTKQNPPVTT